ncbi:DUF4236 domain-containing protein [Amycolatopsis samaneae]|uniref:DUF4236 domain-containing protein n=2 Tax=Amycolatopsis samaneae TaxID=664691 RepID=A0ABW5GR27_9PSEU
MGFRYRKSFRVAPGVRMTVSKSEVGYSVGGKGIRVTKRARGGMQTTISAPGTGLSYTTSTRRRTRRANAAYPAPTSHSASPTRRTPVLIPMTRRIKTERLLCLVGLLTTVIGFVVLPLLLLALPCLLAGLIMMLLNLKDEMRWYRENQAAKVQQQPPT